ncbi:serine/threonine-protein phosphatase 7 long form homolog [Gossypium raimondii]|uniref:serine/threonine-protein phosphatase 7 long form homolog n=1 Tax=Gossypium raimondii TaxID=29730 RepID=UPI00063ADB98|nr:serine/threonine-protein phosphatase 7 long form homolog [Gossypium raimondii]
MDPLIKPDRHIFDAANKADSYRVIRGRVNGLKKALDARLVPYLEQAGFGTAALIQTSDLRYDLLSALVERWHPETYTFHFLCGECTVTLEDVTIRLGLLIDGRPVTGVSSFTDPAVLCYQLLGDWPGDDESNFTGLKFTWLKPKFGQLSATATECELMCSVRVYIMHILGGVLMPDANNNKVHLMYLPLLADLSSVRSYSWGSTVLAVLYWELCWTTNPDVVDMGGCLTLLQSWALYRMPFLASVSHQPWSVRPGIERSHTVPIYRLMLEQHAPEGFIWMPYSRPEITNVIPSSTYVHSNIWCTNAPIINFNVVEWYHGDRVLRQFDCIQHIPDYPCEMGEVHGMSKRGKPHLDWGIKHRKFVALWNDRMRRRPQMVMASELQSSLEYIQWYYSCGKPYILGGQSTVVPPHMQQLGGSDPAVPMDPDPVAYYSLEPELEQEPQLDPEQSESHRDSHSYRLDLAGGNYFPSFSEGEYAYEFELFGSYRPQYGMPGPSDPYP